MTLDAMIQDACSMGHAAVQAGVAQLARASAFQAEGRGFESRFPLQYQLPM